MIENYQNPNENKNKQDFETMTTAIHSLHSMMK